MYNPEPFEVAFYQLGTLFINADIVSFRVVFLYLGPTFINAYIVNLAKTWLIETEGNMGVMICLRQGSLQSLNALSRMGRGLMFHNMSSGQKSHSASLALSQQHNVSQHLL